VYVFFAAFSFPAASIVERLGEKCAMTVGGLCYVLYCAAFILPLKRTENPENETLQNMYWHIYVSLIVGAVLVGFGASILWVAQGKYISALANESNMGMFNAVFWAFMMGCLIIGNALGAYVMK